MLSIPHTNNRNIFLFYILSMLNNSWFLIGNWIFFWLRFMTYGQLGWIDAICFAFGMLMEIPTGAISDLVGKKKTLSLGMFLAALGFFVQAIAMHRYYLLFGFLITQAGWAFYSGAAEALAYDSLKEKKEEQAFDEVISVSNILSLATTVVCTLAGIVLYTWYWRSTHFAMVTVYSLAFLATLFLTEPKVDSEQFSFNTYLNQLIQGGKQLTRPILRPLLPLMVILLGVFYMFSYGFVKPAISEHFGFLAREQGFVFAGLSIFSAMLMSAIPWMRKKLNDSQGLLLLSGILGLGFTLVNFLTGTIGVAVIALIVGSGSLAMPWVSVVINREIESKYRATTLSTLSMLTKVPYILAAVLAGQLIQDGYIRQFSLAVGGITLGVVGVSFIWLHQMRKKYLHV